MAKGILIAAMNIGNAAADEFHDWYDTEHLPERQRVPGFLLCQRWIGAASANRRYVALYQLASPEVQASEAWKKAADTEWTRKLRPHFRDHLRLVCKKYVRGS